MHDVRYRKQKNINVTISQKKIRYNSKDDILCAE